MKKLFALAIVAGMMFVSCGNTAEEVIDDQVDQDVTEEVQMDEQDMDVIDMPEDMQEVAEEIAE